MLAHPCQIAGEFRGRFLAGATDQRQPDTGLPGNRQRAFGGDALAATCDQQDIISR